MRRIDDFYRSRFEGEVGPAQLTRLLLRLQGALLANRMEAAKELGLSAGALFVLFILRAFHPDERITPRELREGTMMTSGGVTKVLHTLEDRGLVRRLPNPGDARSAFIGLTEEGERLVESLIPVVQARDRKLLLDPLTEEEAQELARLLGKLDAVGHAY
jgi:DNA-binding MarR family transcriptional regulator